MLTQISEPFLEGERSKKCFWSYLFQTGHQRAPIPLHQPAESQSSLRSGTAWLPRRLPDQERTTSLRNGREPQCLHWYGGDGQYCHLWTELPAMKEAINTCGCHSLLPGKISFIWIISQWRKAFNRHVLWCSMHKTLNKHVLDKHRMIFRLTSNSKFQLLKLFSVNHNELIQY